MAAAAIRNSYLCFCAYSFALSATIALPPSNSISRNFTLQLISIARSWIDVLVIQWLRDLLCKLDMVDEVAFYARINGKSNIGNSSYNRKKTLKSIPSVTL